MSPIRMSKVESAMRATLTLKDAFNQHDIPAILQLMSDDCIIETSMPAPDGAVYSGKEAATRYWQDFFRDQPDAHLQAEDLIGFGKRCILFWKFSRSNGDWINTHLRGVSIFHVENDLICEMRSYVKG
jgi:ketosteroid isomerase-like protein